MDSPDARTMKGYAAALIRHYFWLDTKPPSSPDSRPWTMARELSVWQRLVDAGYTPEDVNGAIAHYRRVFPGKTDPCRMTVFYWRTDGGFNSTPVLEECIAARHKSERTRPRLPSELRRARFSDYLESGAWRDGTRFRDYIQEGSLTPSAPRQADGAKDGMRRTEGDSPNPGSAGEQPGRQQSPAPMGQSTASQSSTGGAPG